MFSFLSSKERRNKKLRSVSYVACDLDGTLLRDDNTISQNTLATIQELRGCGADVVLMSGRAAAFIQDYATKIGSTMPIVSLNGCLITTQSGEVLDATFIPEEACQLICEVGGKYNDLTISAFTAHGILSESREMILPRYLRAKPESQRTVVTLTPYFAETALFVAAGPYAAVQDIIRQTAQAYHDRLDRVFYQSQMGIDQYYLEIRRKGASKGTALLFLAKYLRVRSSAFAAIGDFDNDIEMCTFAGVSAAPRNAIDRLKESVDFVLKNTNNDDAAAEFFRLIIHERRRATKA